MTGSLVILGTIPGNLAECEELETQVRSIYQRLKDAEEIIAPLSEKASSWQGESKNQFVASHHAEIDAWQDTTDGVNKALSAIRTYLTKLQRAHHILSGLEKEAQQAYSRYRASCTEYPLNALGEYLATIQELQSEWDQTIKALDDCGREQAAYLFASLHDEPSHVFGDTPLIDLSQEDLKYLETQLNSLDPSLVDQRVIGDCYFLATLAGVLDTDEGKEFIKQHVKPHKNQFNQTDGFLVTLYERDRNGQIIPREVFVDRIYADGARGNGKPSIASIYEAAFGQIHPGGTANSIFGNGITAGRHGVAYEAITGKPSHCIMTVRNGANHPDLAELISQEVKQHRQEIIGAVSSGQATTAMSLNPLGSLTPDGGITVRPYNPDTGEQVSGDHGITLYSWHVYTVLDANEKYVRMRNPHGTSPDPDGVFCLTWEEYERSFAWTSYGVPLSSTK